ncbi:MAG: arylesterase [Gammaproteobacteria bacterium]|nr:arylesterase [Gammaproteobacteria bacterium]
MLKTLLIVGLLFCAAPATAAPPVILVLGDSLSAGYGFDLRQGWVTLLQQRLEREGFPHRAVNASTSGDTSRGGLARLPRALDQHRPTIVVIELGGNDGLRGLPIAELRANLGNAIRLAQQHGAKVLLVGMRLPTNYGTSHTREFQELYADLGKKYRVPVVPFFLEGVATDPELMQPDGVHPTAAAQPKLLATVWPYLVPLLK